MLWADDMGVAGQVKMISLPPKHLDSLRFAEISVSQSWLTRLVRLSCNCRLFFVALDTLTRSLQIKWASLVHVIL